MAANDMKAAQSTYAFFISMIKYAIPIIAAIVVFVVLLIAN